MKLSPLAPAAATKCPETRRLSFLYLCRYLGDTVGIGCLILAVFQLQWALSASCSLLDVYSVGNRPAVFSLWCDASTRSQDASERRRGTPCGGPSVTWTGSLAGSRACSTTPAGSRRPRRSSAAVKSRNN